MNKVKRTRRKRCKECDKLFPKGEVIHCVDPYEEDVNQIVIWVHLCVQCYNTKLADINLVS